MRFEPKNEVTLEKEKAELASKRLMKYGTICDCEVVNAADEISSKQNEMIHLTLRVFTPDGDEKIFDDYIVSSMEFKLRHAADTFGILEKYEMGMLEAADFFNKSGKCKMGIQRDKTGQYPDKNVISDYVKRSAESAPAVQNKSSAQTMIDDEVPF